LTNFDLVNLQKAPEVVRYISVHRASCLHICKLINYFACWLPLLNCRPIKAGYLPQQALWLADDACLCSIGAGKARISCHCDFACFAGNGGDAGLLDFFLCVPPFQVRHPTASAVVVAHLSLADFVYPFQVEMILGPIGEIDSIRIVLLIFSKPALVIFIKILRIRIKANFCTNSHGHQLFPLVSGNLKCLQLLIIYRHHAGRVSVFSKPS
jgi:hypothetical protein